MQKNEELHYLITNLAGMDAKNSIAQWLTLFDSALRLSHFTNKTISTNILQALYSVC